MYPDRRSLYKKLEELRCSKVLVYITGDRPGLGTQIHSEVLSFFTDHLDVITERRRIPKISLFLYTSGGFTMAAWGIVNLLRQFCDNYEVIVPSKAHSAGTIIALGADKIIMTKQATLSPIDPSINSPLNPVTPSPGFIGQGGTLTVPVSVEAISGFISFIKQYSAITQKGEFSKILLDLADKVHPLVIGQSYRAKKQIHQIATKLLEDKIRNKKQRKNTIRYLTEESGSHDYTIYRNEAEKLDLPVDKPDEKLYTLIKTIFDNISEELELNNPFSPSIYVNTSEGLVPYSFRRALIESNGAGSHIFLQEGVFQKTIYHDQSGISQEAINDKMIFQGWRHEFS